MPIHCKQQRGFALIISLLLLVAMTLLVVSAMRSTTLQERMTVNMHQRELARQVAEATIFFASRQLPPAGNPSWYHPNLPTPSFGQSEAWRLSAGWGTTEIELDGVKYPAEYQVENLGFWTSRDDPTCKVKENPLCERQTYRITARAKAQDGQAQVTLQAIWRL